MKLFGSGFDGQITRLARMLGILLVVAAAGCHQPRPLVGEKRDAEEVAVYRAVVSGLVAGGAPQVVDGTATVPRHLPGRESLQPEVDGPEFDDFIARVSVESPLQSTASLPANWVVVPSAAIHDWFDGGPRAGLARLYELYPESTGIVTLSRVGFSTNGLRALVYVGVWRGPLAGSGALYMMRKAHGRWEVQSTHASWIS